MVALFAKYFPLRLIIAFFLVGHKEAQEREGYHCETECHPHYCWPLRATVRLCDKAVEYGGQQEQNAEDSEEDRDVTPDDGWDQFGRRTELSVFIEDVDVGWTIEVLLVWRLPHRVTLCHLFNCL